MFDELDVTDLLDFAKRYNDLGEAVQEQLDSLLDGNQDNWHDDINPNAVKLLKEHLGGFHPDIDDAIQNYADWLKAEDDSETENDE